MIPERPIAWNIGTLWIFYVLAALAVAAFVYGAAAHVRVWRKAGAGGRLPFTGKALKEALLDTFLNRPVFRGDTAAGIMHLLIFWGFVLLLCGTTLLAFHEYLIPFLRGRAHLLFEISLEVGGLFLLTGLLWALVRRYVQRIPRLERRLEDALVPLALLLAAVTGFLLEGLRIAAQSPPWGGWSFVGAWIGGAFSEGTALALYPYLWWGHALLSLGCIALIPFSKLFHVVGAPAAFYARQAALPQQEAPDTEAPPAEEEPHGAEDTEGTGEMGEMPLEQTHPLPLEETVFYDACMRCGRCVEVCPSNGAGEPFAPRAFVQAARQALWKDQAPGGDIRFFTPGEELPPKTAWYCTTCAACLEVCPVYGAAFRVVTRKRQSLVEEGKGVPDLMNQTLERLYNYENPWVSSKRERGALAKALEVPVLRPSAKEAPLCYFVGCTTSYDARAQGIARAFTGILKRVGVPFGILGDKEPCCGDIARVTGETGLFEEKREGLMELLDRMGVGELVTSSPHCYHTLSREYPGRPFEVRHYTLLLKELIDEKRLVFDGGAARRVTYHDPCYLGRHNRVFEAPREILRAIPGTRLVEMSHHGPDSLCCGGGGGRMWQGTELRGEARMSEIRMREAAATGAEILVTACPLCLVMLEDAMKTLGLEKTLKVMDMNELVLASLTGEKERNSAENPEPS